MALTFCELCSRTTHHLLNNCTEHSNYVPKAPMTVASPETLGLLAQVREKRRKKELSRKRRQAAKVEEARLRKWQETGKDKRSTVRVTIPSSGHVKADSLASCLACGAAIGEVNSYPADVAISFFRRDEVIESPVVDGVTYIGDIQGIKTISYPVTKRGRVCRACTLAKGVTLLPEWSDRSKESSNILSEARPQNYRLNSTRFDRARGFGPIFDNRKE